MSQRLCSAATSGLLLASLSLILAGCGADAAPVTAQNSQFRPAGEGNSEPAPAGTPAADPSPPANTGPAPAEGGSLKTEAAAPSGSIAELKEQVVALTQRPMQGKDQREQMAHVLRTVDQQVAMLNKILDSEPSKEDKDWVVNVATQIFVSLEQSGIPGARDKTNAFVANLLKRPDPELARQGRHLAYSLQTIDLVNQRPDDGTEVLALVKQFLAGESKDLTIAALAKVAQTAEILMQVGLRKDAIAALQLAADAAKGSQDEKVAKLAGPLRDQATVAGLDFDALELNVFAGEPDAPQKVLEAIKEAAAKTEPSHQISSLVQRQCQILDATGHGDVALLCLEELEKLAERTTDKQLADEMRTSIANSRKRAALLGQPFTVEGVTKDGQPFDWSAYQGKVVLVDFWATWCGPCLEEIPNIMRNYDEFHELGFEVVGVNLDTKIDDVKKFLELQELPWTTVVAPEVFEGKVDDADPTGFAKLPMAVKCGVDGIPFLVLVGKDGKVDSLHARGPKLRSRLVALLGEPGDTPASDKPAAEKPATVRPAVEKPATETPAKPGEEKPAAEKPAEAKGEQANKQSAITPLGVALAVALLGADEPAAAAPAVSTADDPAINPYAAKPGLSSEQLANYLLKMLDKPKTIQGRPGFCEAVCDACDRLMSASPPATEVQFFVAAEAKFETLHKKACTGDAEADKLLAALVEKMQGDERPRIARQVAFFQQERKVLDAIDGPVERVPDVLKELQDYFAKEKLGAKHLRMASSTVALINRLNDGDEREKQFGEFGKTFATSSNKELARYGKKLAKKPAATESDLVGKPLELAGTTAKGADFVWDAYRGKVVLVDFWATWCGPCRREMPHVKELYEKFHDKSFDVVGVSLDEDQEALADYLEENAIAWDTLAGEGTQELAEKYGVRGIPTMMLVDKEGKIVGVAHNVAALAPLVEKLMAAPAAAAPAR